MVAQHDIEVYVLIIEDPTVHRGFTFGGVFRSEEAAEAAFVETYGADAAPEEAHIHWAVLGDD